MPIYEYKCKECDQKFEIFVFSNTQENIPCAKCGSKNTEKVISKFAPSGGFNFGGSSCSGTGGFS
jgi:putative FmdB family regulatory protein